MILKIFKLAIDDNISPRIDLVKNPNYIGDMMFSNQKIQKMDDRECEVLIPKNENPRVSKSVEKSGLASKMENPFQDKDISVEDGIFEAILDKFYTDPTLIAYGEDNRDWGGAFGVYRGLTESLPYHRFSIRPFLRRPLLALL